MSKTLEDMAMDLFESCEIITCCAESYKAYLKGAPELDIRIDDVWIKVVPPCKDYQHYTHTLHPDIIKAKYPQRWKKWNGEL